MARGHESDDDDDDFQRIPREHLQFFDPDDELQLHGSETPGMVLVNTPLNGKNYLLWRNAMVTALESKNKFGFDDGTCEMSDVRSPLFKKWRCVNSMVLSWLKNALAPELAADFQFVNDAKELWDELAHTYGTCNSPMVFELKRDISLMHQGDLTILSITNQHPVVKRQAYLAETPFDDNSDEVTKLQDLVNAAVQQEVNRLIKGKGTTILSLLSSDYTDSISVSDWIDDTRATCHMSCSIDNMVNLRNVTVYTPVFLPDGSIREVHKIGEVVLSPSLTLTGCLYIPSFKHNLLSVEQLAQSFLIFFSDTFCLLQDLKSGHVIAAGKVV
ncbi:OLC1v1036026C1 [Oldenlandia corymbosa var. corymbosa]|uniref:OLC1v1036026C1 n=1 Tax=Oldenlandia corymbosa var. corymbosa TaxID=529605 RepID=A0AAV1CV51_OLDCO|nr:OLC1v1036026C1 [Oldenlandia corymbosa var. corymbosa]